MRNQPRVEEYDSSPLFADGAASRHPVEGTIARGQLPLDTAYLTGQTSSGFLERNPEELTLALLERGQQRFRIFCVLCHGEIGNGEGVIVQRGFPEASNYHEERLLQAPDGYLFDVITNGYGRMMPWKAQIPVKDRWALVGYIRALQLSQNAPLSLLTEKERSDLEAAP
jgi:hypothetical protein